MIFQNWKEGSSIFAEWKAAYKRFSYPTHIKEYNIDQQNYTRKPSIQQWDERQYLGADSLRNVGTTKSAANTASYQIVPTEAVKWVVQTTWKDHHIYQERSQGIRIDTERSRLKGKRDEGQKRKDQKRKV